MPNIISPECSVVKRQSKWGGLCAERLCDHCCLVSQHPHIGATIILVHSRYERVLYKANAFSSSQMSNVIQWFIGPFSTVWSGTRNVAGKAWWGQNNGEQWRPVRPIYTCIARQSLPATQETGFLYCRPPVKSSRYPGAEKHIHQPFLLLQIKRDCTKLLEDQISAKIQNLAV